MSEMRIQEAKGGAAQLSQGKFFLMTQKFRINKGANVGKGLIVVKLSELYTEQGEPDNVLFKEVKSFLLSQHQFDTWIALLMQVSNRQLTEIKDGEPVGDQKKL